MSYAEEARTWHAKAALERKLAERAKEKLLDQATRNVKSGRVGSSPRLSFEQQVIEEHERLLEGPAGKYRSAHYTAAREFTQYGILAAMLAELEAKGL